MTIIRKTVAIHPIMDQYVRKTWALLVESGLDASYSTALNFMLLAAIHEALKPGGLSEKTRDVIWNFARDEKTVKDLNLEEQLANVVKNFSLVEEREERSVVKVSRRRLSKG